MKQQGRDSHGFQPRFWRLIWLLMGVAAAILLAAFLAAGLDQSEPLMDNNVVRLKDGWTDEGGNDVTLPLKRVYRAEGYRFQIVLPQGDGSPRNLLISAKYLNLRLYWNQDEVGECLCRPPGQEKTQGKVFSLLTLPAEEGTLRLEAEPLLGEKVSYEIAAPRLGTSGALVYELIAEELPMLAITAVIFCFGLFLLICGVQALSACSMQEDTRTFQANFLHIGLFALLFSLYSFAITDTVHLFLPNSHLIYLMEFLLLTLLPLPLLASAGEVCTARFRIPLAMDCCALFFNFALQVFLHFALGLELRDYVSATHLLMVISALLLIPALICAGRKEEGTWWPLLSFSPVLAGAMIDIFRFYLPIFHQNVVGFQIGVLVFLLLQTAYLLRQNLSYYESYLRSGAYRQMAYTDALTGLQNRAAFEVSLTELQEKLESYSSIWCISADINNLKQTNDTLGHAAGDALIRHAAQLLRAGAGKNAKAYRIGGDEFVLLLFDQSEAAVRAVLSRLSDAVDQYNCSHTPGLSIALGCDRFHFSGEDTMARLLSRADGLMYEDKRNWKQAHGQEHL